MSPEQGKRELDYQVVILPARGMLQQGFITPEEYHRIETIFKVKYRPIFGESCAETLAIPTFQS